MGIHNLPYQMEEAFFKSATNTFRGPEGLVLGFGTTVGNSIEGWAPNAIFVDTDAAQGSGVFTNTGTKTTATWTEIADAGVAGGFAMTGAQTLTDAASIVFGTGSDLKLQWDGAKMTSGPPTGLWAGAPSPLDPSPYLAHTFFDEFYQPPLDANLRWVEVDDGATGTNAVSDIAGGVGTIVTAAADNDYHAISSKAESFDLLGTKELWFEARFRLVEAATNESAWWIGLSDTLTTGGFQADAAGPLASYDGVLVWKDEATMAIDAESSNAGTQDTETNIATFVTNTWTRVGFHISLAATTAVVTPYFDVSDSGIMTAHSATMNLTRAGLEAMHVLLGVKAGPAGNAETLEVDYVKCVQMR